MSKPKAQHYQLNIPLEIDYTQLAAKIEPARLALASHEAVKALEDAASELWHRALEEHLLLHVANTLVDDGRLAAEMAGDISLEDLAQHTSEEIGWRIDVEKLAYAITSTRLKELADSISAWDVANQIDLEELSDAIDYDQLAEVMERRAQSKKEMSSGKFEDLSEAEQREQDHMAHQSECLDNLMDD